MSVLSYQLPLFVIEPVFNNVAVRTIKVVFLNILDISCFSHILHHVGEKFNAPVLEISIGSHCLPTRYKPNLCGEIALENSKNILANKLVEQIGMHKRGLIP